jgi:hypothetical protein
MKLPALVTIAVGLGLIVMYYIDNERKRKEEEQEKKDLAEQTTAPTITLLDYQFNNMNFPSKQYSGMFYSSTPWLHGRGLGDGKVMVLRDP